MFKKWINLNAKSLLQRYEIRYYDFAKKICICLQMQQHIWMKMAYEKNLRASHCCLCALPKRKKYKISIFYGIRFIANRDMICMRQHQLALPSKMHVHKFHVSLFFMQIPLWKIPLYPTRYVHLISLVIHDFPFFLISFHFLLLLLPFTWLNSIWFFIYTLTSSRCERWRCCLLLPQRHHHCITRSRCNTIYMAWIVISL